MPKIMSVYCQLKPVLRANPPWHSILVNLTAATTINTAGAIVSLEISAAMA